LKHTIEAHRAVRPAGFMRRMTLGDMNATASRLDPVECAGTGG
jgi:hypothetical protein